jgi:predicted GNAT family acetyltransferase
VEHTLRQLQEEDCEETLAFLSQTPLDAVHLIGMIEDNGIVSPFHRGNLFGYFENKKLAAVALLGHSILLHGKEESFPYFAEAAIDSNTKGHVIFGPRKQVENFWSHLEKHERKTRLVRQHNWYVCGQPFQALRHLQLTQATLEELTVVANAQAEMALEESGIDPRESDSLGFFNRVAERIKRGRIWVKMDDGKVIFKADLISQTQEVSYIEGIWTHPDCRNQGIATTCVSELAHRLLHLGSTPCLVVEPHEEAARRVYERVGFICTDEYQARYLMPLEA